MYIFFVICSAKNTCRKKAKKNENEKERERERERE